MATNNEPLETVLERARDGSVSAFNTLILRLSPFVFSFVRRSQWAISQATDPAISLEDITQEVFLVFYKRLPHVNALNARGLVRWVKTVSYRVTLRWTQKGHKRSAKYSNDEYADDIGFEEIDFAAPLDDEEFEALAKLARGELTPVEREMIELKGIGKSHDDLAKYFGITVDRSRYLLWKARKQLTDILIRMGAIESLGLQTEDFFNAKSV